MCLGLGVHPPGSTAHVGCIPPVNDVCLHVGCTPSFVPETCYHPFTHLYPIQCAHTIKALQSIVITSLLILLIYITHPVSLSLSPSPPPPPPTTPSPLHTGSCTSARQALDYVVRPPPPTHRVYCTVIPSSPVSPIPMSGATQWYRHSTFYTLYVEHMGTLIPVLLYPLCGAHGHPHTRPSTPSMWSTWTPSYLSWKNTSVAAR